jgi:hypothetical protein
LPHGHRPKTGSFDGLTGAMPGKPLNAIFGGFA